MAMMLELIESLLLKNRTIVSSDAEACMAFIQARFPVTVHRFPTGGDHQTWTVPPEWNVRSAVLRDGARVIASYDESPFFLAPYSLPFSGTVTRDDLLQHTFTNPSKPDAFCYEHRVGANSQRRLQEWRISLPYDRVMALPAGPFQLEIDVEVRPGNLLIAEVSHPGASGDWFTLLAHYCHPAQANDGLAGVAIMLEVMDRVRRRHPAPRHGYKALILPETFGTSIYAATHEAELDRTLGAVFSEMGGAEAPLQFKYSRRGDTYVDRVFLHVLQQAGKLPCRTIPFRDGWGNDELVFDAPGLGVPAVSLDRFPFAAYHTHHDNMSLVHLERLEEVVDLLVAVVDAIERDYVPVPRHRVPVYLTRYGLYADWTHERAQYDMNVVVVESMWSGLSVLDIALTHHLDVNQVYDYVGRFVDLGLVDAAPLTPAYSRQTRFLA